MDPQPQSAGEIFLKNVFLRYRVKEIAKRWKKLAKKSKQRYYKLREWSTTQQTYLKKLVVLRDEVRDPLKASGMIGDFEQRLIFSNLESMIQLGLEMQEKIAALVKNWHPMNTVLAPTVQSLSIYLKIYKDYSNNFQKADAIMQELKKSPKFKETVKVDYVEDYLIKPVQRPLQYKLFVADYLKDLPPRHKDRPALEKAQKKLLDIAEQINEFVESQMRSARMVQLDKMYGDLIESSRVYKSQFQAETLECKCRVYVFNDLLLGAKIVNPQKQEALFRINLCGGSFVSRRPDNKSFKNRLYICGTHNGIHLFFPSQTELERIKQMLQNIISNIYQKDYNRQQLISKVKYNRETIMIKRNSINQEYKWKEQPTYKMRMKIQVIGVEKRLYTNQWKIVYAVRIQLGRPEHIYQIAFYELDELRELQRYINQVFPNAKIPSVDTRYKGMAADDVKNDFTKYAEYRTIIIEDFLNGVLRCPQISERPELVAFKLRINEAIWEYLNKVSVQFSSNECGCNACLHNEIFTGLDFYEKQRICIRKRLYPFCIYKSFHTQNTIAEMLNLKNFKQFKIEDRLMWAVCKERRLDYGVLLPDQFGKSLTFFVNINLISEDSVIVLKEATVNSTCRQIVEQICQRRGIKTTRDLTLVYVNDQYEHFLDDDEYIVDYVTYLEQNAKKEQPKRGSRLSLFSSFSKNFDDLGQLAFENPDRSNKPRLFLRKLYTFSHSLEEKACEQNYERYPIILGELLKKFKEQYLLLSISELKVFCALFYSIEEFNTIIFSKKIFVQAEKVRKYLPESKWNFVDGDFLEQIRAIIENQVKLCDNITLLYRCILRQFGDKTGWLTKYFNIENLEPKSLSGSNVHLLIGVSFKKVIVTRKYNLANLLQFPLDKFEYRISGNSLFVETGERLFRFQGNNLLLFHNMVQRYKLMEDAARS